MRGRAVRQATMLTAVTPDALVPQDHPIRKIKPLVDGALTKLSRVFHQMYANEGRPSNRTGAFAERLPADPPLLGPQ